jgi:xanthine/uracil permease
MIGIQGQSIMDYETVAISFGVFILVIILSNKGKGWIKSYAVLMGILLGWLLYFLLGKNSTTISEPVSLVKLPEIFAWGTPRLNTGMIITSILFTFILVSNKIAAVSAAKQVYPKSEKEDKQTMNRSIWTGGISHVISSLFSTIGIVPLPVSVGFIQLTGQKRIGPFLIASLALSCIAVIPPIVNFLALLPGPIASAALLASFVQVIGIAFQTLRKEDLDQRQLTILGVTLIISIGLMILPKGIFQGLPTILQYILNNGLLVGTIIVILLEQLWKKREKIVDC